MSVVTVFRECNRKKVNGMLLMGKIPLLGFKISALVYHYDFGGVYLCREIIDGYVSLPPVEGIMRVCRSREIGRWRSLCISECYQIELLVGVWLRL